MASQLFRKKSPDHLMAEAAAPDRQMKRTLGAFALTCIGIGAIIGAGIFSLTGTAAAGQTFGSRLETPVMNFIQAWFSGADVVLFAGFVVGCGCCVGAVRGGPRDCYLVYRRGAGMRFRRALLCRVGIDD